MSEDKFINDRTLKSIRGIFEEVVDLSGLPFGPDAVLGEDIPVDSKEMLQILSRIEGRYRFHFRHEHILGLRTVGDLLRIIGPNL